MSRAAGGGAGSSGRGRGRWTVAGGLWLLFTTATIWFASNTVPSIEGDAIYFIPTAHSIRVAGTWLSPAAAFLDPQYVPGTPARYVYHGWLYPFVVAHLAPEASWPGIFLGRAIVTSLALGAILLWAVPTFRTARAAAAMTVVAAAVLTYASGRPEALAAPLLLLLALRTLNHQASVIPDGILFGLLFACQPTICMTAAVGYSIHRLLRERFRRAIMSVVAVGAVALAVALLLFVLIYPYSIADWIAGVIDQARGLAARNEWRGFARYYIVEPGLPLLAVPVAGAATILLLSSARPMAGAATPAFRIAGAAVFLVLLLFGALKVPPTLYNIVPWLLLFTWFALVRLEAAKPGDPWRGRIAVGSLGVLLLSATGALAYGMVQNGISSVDRRGALEAGQGVVRQVLASCRHLRVNFPLVPLLGSEAASPRVRYADQPRRAGASAFPPPPDAVIQTQYRADADEAPQIPGMTLVYSSYAPAIRIPGVPKFDTPTAHNFAVLLRDGSPCMAGFARDREAP